MGGQKLSHFSKEIKQFIQAYLPVAPLIEEFANYVECGADIETGNSFRGLLTALGELLNSFKEIIKDGLCWFPCLMRRQTSKGEVCTGTIKQLAQNVEAVEKQVQLMGIKMGRNICIESGLYKGDLNVKSQCSKEYSHS